MTKRYFPAKSNDLQKLRPAYLMWLAEITSLSIDTDGSETEPPIPFCPSDRLCRLSVQLSDRICRLSVQLSDLPEARKISAVRQASKRGVTNYCALHLQR